MSDSELADYIAKIRQEVSEWPDWKKNLLADSVNPYWRDEKTMSDSDKMRQEFEEEARAIGLSLRPMKGSGGSKYWNDDTNLALRVWQAAYAAGRKAERENIWKFLSPEARPKLIKLLDDSETKNEGLNNV